MARVRKGSCPTSVGIMAVSVQTIEAGPGDYRLVRLANGAHSLHSVRHGETFHPVVGPVAEAEGLYVRQLKARERVAAAGSWVVWDVGLGAAANPLTLLMALSGLEARIRVVSFDHTLEPLNYALGHAARLGYLQGWEAPLGRLAREGGVCIQQGGLTVEWTLHLGDFPSLVSGPAALEWPKPDAILFDAFSPATNPAMWTLPLFARVFGLLDPARPCALPTYSRSTMLRVTLLLAGFQVGVGHATGEKEETTMASNSPDWVDQPLGRTWLERVRRSTSAEPLHEPHYRQAPLSPESLARLERHPQFLGSLRA